MLPDSTSHQRYAPPTKEEQLRADLRSYEQQEKDALRSAKRFRELADETRGKLLELAKKEAGR